MTVWPFCFDELRISFQGPLPPAVPGAQWYRGEHRHIRQEPDRYVCFRIGSVNATGRVRFLRSASKGADPAGDGIFQLYGFWPTAWAVPKSVQFRFGKDGTSLIYVFLFIMFWLGLWHNVGFTAEEKGPGQPGATGSGKTVPAEVRFLRVYAPADRVEQWPWGEMKYVPVEGAEFERLIRHGEQSVAGPTAQPRISWGKCRAAFSEPDVLEGECILDIYASDQQPRVLRWPKCPLAIRTAAWVDAEGKALEPASVGLSESGQTELAASRSGRLRLEWSLQGRQEGAGVRFDLWLPPSPHTELRLEVPESLRPVLPGALIRLHEPPPAPGRKIWLLEWSGQIGGPLQLTPEEDPSPSAKMLVHQDTQYTLLPEGLEGVALFAIQALGEPVCEVSFLVEAGLEVTAVRWADQNLSWRWDARAAAGLRRLWVLLPQPIHKEVQTVRVEVVGPVVLAASWPLPRIRLEGAIWQQGTWSLRIGSGLEVQRLAYSHCQQSKAALEGAELGPGEEHFEFQAYSPDAAVEVVLARREPVAQFDLGTVVIFSERQINARIRARVRADAGEHFVLQAQVGRRWLIDAVEADPDAQVEDWTVDSANQRLTIRLARPVTAQRPVNLQIVGRRLQSPVGRTWRTEDLLPVRFTGLREGKHLVALSSPDVSYELICLRPEPAVLVNPRQLKPAEWELVDKLSEGLFFWASPQNQPLQWLLRPRIAQYRAKIQVDVVATAKSVSERYRMECIPEGSRVERVVIIFSHARAEPLQWTISGDAEHQWTVRRLTENDLPSDQWPSEGEAWEIQFRPSRSGAFVIQAQRSTPLGDQMPVALAALPQAAQQEATLRVRTVGPGSPQIVSGRLPPIPLAEEEVVPGTSQLAAFRYEPKQVLSETQESALRLHALPNGQSGRQTWAWQARLDSWLQPDGLGEHIAIYRLANFHHHRLRLRIPCQSGSTQIKDIWLNGQPARWQVQRPSQESAEVSVELAVSPERTLSTLAISFQTRQPSFRHGGTVLPCWPDLDVPVLNRSWTLWLPPGWRARCPRQYTLWGEGNAISLRERLFGIWARPTDRQPFDPFVPEHWKSLFGQDSAFQRDRQQAEAFFRAVGVLLRRPPSISVAASGPSPSLAGQRWTWGELLQQESLRQVGKMLIDRQGVWEAGIDPASPVRTSMFSTQATEDRIAREAFWQARLALGIYRGMILITSLERASGWPGCAQNLADPLVWRIGPETGDRLLNLRTLDTESRWVSPHTWQESAETAASGISWPGTAPSGATMLGWTCYAMEVPETSVADQPLEIELRNEDVDRTWYWTAFLTVGGLALMLAKRHWGRLLTPAGVLAAVALVVPDSWVAPASGAFGAVLAVAVFGLLWPRSQRGGGEALPAPSAPEPTLPNPSPGTSSSRVITVGICWLAAILGIAVAHGAEPSTAIAPSAGVSPLYRVFIPVDDQEQPTGDPYQVPEPFYQYLRRRAQTAAPAVSGWRLRQALYRAEFSPSPTTGRGEIPRVNLMWQWDLVGKVSQISLPILRQQFPIVPDTWLVEGQPIEPQWNEAGTVLILPIPVSAPTVRMEGQIRPGMVAQAGWRGIEAVIPRTPLARLELTLPPDAPEVHLEGAVGVVKQVNEPSPRLVAELGPTERLSVRWPVRLPTSAEPPLPELDELLWLRVQPGAVLLEARFRISGGPGRSVRPGLRLMVENRLRLVGWQGTGSGGEVTIKPSPGGQIVEFLFPSSPQDQMAVLAARFLLTDTTGVGNVRLPKLEPFEVRVARRWLAVSVDPSLESPLPQPNRPHAVPVEEFLNLWGSADMPPQFVDNLAAVGAGWTLVCRPRTPNSSVEQTLWLGYGEKTVRVSYEARLTTTSGPCFQHRLQTPPDLQIETISILQENASVPIRWARTPDGKLNIFSYKPLVGRYELHLTGSCPNLLSHRRPIPYVELESSETEWATLVLCRQPEVMLRLVKAEGLTEMEPPTSTEGKSALGRLFKAFVVDPRQIADAELLVLPNRPQATCQQITLIRPEVPEWLAEVELNLHVHKGMVDEIVVEAPACWPGPYKTTPQVTVSTKELAEGRRALVLRPPAPVEQSYRIRIAGPLRWPKTGTQELPAILPLHIPVTEHQVLLPTRDPFRPLVWQTQGMEKTARPEPFNQELLRQGHWEAYRVIGGQFTARLQAGSQHAQPEVRLADIHFRWEADGACSGKAQFYLLPGGQDRCVLCLPPGFRLLHVQVDKNPSPPLLHQDTPRYTVLLSSSVLPQVMEVSFLGRLPPGVLEGLQPFPVPWIENWSVGASLWTIYSPASYELAEPEGVGRISPLRLNAYRLQTIAGLLETTCRQMPEPREDFLPWYWGWRERFSAIVRQVQRELTLPPATEVHRSLRTELQSFQLKLTQLAESLALPESPPGNTSAPPTSADLAAPPFEGFRPHAAVCRAVLHGRSQGLLLTYEPKKNSRSLWRWLFAAGILGATLLLAWLGSIRFRASALATWPQMIGLLAGGIWWLWLWPSVLGLGLILLTLLAGLPKPLPTAQRSRSHRHL